MSTHTINATHRKASVLAIGTELTTGQVTNRNAAWISERLDQMGIEVVLHLTVADDRARIKQALDHCAESSQLIFVTGGLGPTQDDFTREVISDWLKAPLEFHEPSWDWIVQRLTRFEIPVAPSNRQQCYFPKGFQLLPNPEGTAAGFTLRLGEKQIWILPGPPREVAAVWNQGIEKQVCELVPDRKPNVLFTWQCLGKSEAELGEITENALKGSDLLTGYRAHRPFVEVKVWCPSDSLKENQHWIAKLEKAISPWIFTKQGEDFGRRLLKQLQRYESVEIFDLGTGGLLASRLSSLLKEPEYHELAKTITLASEWRTLEESHPEEIITQVFSNSDSNSTTLVISNFSLEGVGGVGLQEVGRTLRESFQLPYRKVELLDRMQAYTVEYALKIWCKWLETATH